MQRASIAHGDRLSSSVKSVLSKTVNEAKLLFNGSYSPYLLTFLKFVFVFIIICICFFVFRFRPHICRWILFHKTSPLKEHTRLTEKKSCLLLGRVSVKVAKRIVGNL